MLLSKASLANWASFSSSLFLSLCLSLSLSFACGKVSSLNEKSLASNTPTPSRSFYHVHSMSSNVWLFLLFSPSSYLPIYYYSEYFWCRTRARKSFVLSFSSFTGGQKSEDKNNKNQENISKARRYLHLWSVTSQRQMSERGILLAGFGLFFPLFFFLLLLAYSEDGEGLLCLVKSEE